MQKGVLGQDNARLFKTGHYREVMYRVRLERREKTWKRPVKPAYMNTPATGHRQQEKNAAITGHTKEETMKTLAIWNLKGGIGKTTTAINLAYSLVEDGKKVLLIDMDQQGNASSMMRRYNLHQRSITEVLEGRCYVLYAAKKTWIPGLYIIPADIRVRALTPQYHLTTAAKELDKEYDYCIIDCPPAAGAITREAVQAAAQVIIPVPATRWGCEGLDMVSDLIEEMSCGTERKILFTMFKNNAQSRKQIQTILESYQIPTYETAITRTEDAISAENMRKPIARCRKHSQAAADYRELAKEVMEDAKVK